MSCFFKGNKMSDETEILNSTEGMILKYAGAKEDFDSVIDAVGTDELRNVVDAVKSLECRVEVFGSSLNDGKDAREIATSVINRHKEWYNDLEKVYGNNEQANQGLTNMVAAARPGPTSEQWDRFSEMCLEDLDRMNSSYARMNAEATKWTAGRIILSTLDKACRRLHSTGLDGSGIRELEDLGRALAQSRRVAQRMAMNLAEADKKREKVYENYTYAFSNAWQSSEYEPLERSPEPGVLKYLRSAGTLKTAYDADRR